MAIVIIDVIIAQPHGTVGLQGDFASGSAGREGVKDLGDTSVLKKCFTHLYFTMFGILCCCLDLH